MTSTIKFTKGEGTGNDFVLVYDESGNLQLSEEQIARICDRRFGVGADGLIRVVKSEFVPEGKDLLSEELEAKWFMDYYNADGSVAEMCGNGVRVFARYLTEHDLARVPEGGTLAVATRAGIKDLTPSSNGFAVDLGRWRLEGDWLVHAEGLEVPRPGLGVNVGNPHVVVVLASEEELSALRLYEGPRVEPFRSEGTNVEFVVPRDPLVKDGVGFLSMRVHERGVGETLSCGTGIAAAALATRSWAGTSAPNHWQVQVPGGLVGVRMFATEDGEHVSINGPAELIFEGEIAI